MTSLLNSAALLACLDAVDGSDVGVLQLGQKFGFPFKTSQPLGILRELLRQYLDGNFTAQVGVLSPIDFSHASFTDLLENLVMRDGRANDDVSPSLCSTHDGSLYFSRNSRMVV